MKKTVVIVLRTLVLTLLLLALLDLPIPLGTLPRTVVFLIDTSASVSCGSGPTPEEAHRLALGHAMKLSPHDRVALITFASRPRVDIPLSSPDRITLPPQEETKPEPESDIGRALQRAVALLAGKTSGEIILCSDGRDTGGTLDQALLSARAMGVTIHTLPLGPPNPQDARIASVEAPGEVDRGERFSIRVNLSSTYSVEADVQVGPKKRRLRIHPNTLQSTTFEDFEIGDRPQISYTILVEPTDACPENNRCTLTVRRRIEKPRILIVSEGQSAMAPLLSGQKDWEIKPGGPLQAPQEYAAIVLDNVRTDEFSPSQLESLRSAVEDWGTGVLILGGPKAYALGGMQETALEAISPLWGFPDERASTVFLLDRSGSMADSVAGRSKLQLAVDALLASLKLFHSQDRVGILSFSDTSESLIPLIPVAETNTIYSKLRGLVPYGGTQIAPALEEAARLLMSASTARRHIVLITDSETAEEIESLLQAADSVNSTRAGLSLLLTRSGGAERRTEWTRRCRGQTFVMNDLSELPQALKQIIQRSKELVLEDEGGLTLETLSGPPLTLQPKRLNRTSARPNSETQITCKGHPVVARRRAGRGMVIATTISLDKAWIGPKIPEDFSAAIRQWIRDVLAPRSESMRVELLASPGTLTLRGRAPLPSSLAAVDGCIIHAESGRSCPVRFERRGIDLLETQITLRDPGTYAVKTYDPSYEGTASLLYAPEFSTVGMNVPQLERIAAGTGGQILTTPDSLSMLAAQTATKRVPGRSYFLLAAAVAFLLEVAVATLWRR